MKRTSPVATNTYHHATSPLLPHKVQVRRGIANEKVINFVGVEQWQPGPAQGGAGGAAAPGSKKIRGPLQVWPL
jgi:hypothetical protein